MANSASHVLLTGATGLIGRRWLALLLGADPVRRITSIARDPTQVPPHPRVRVVAGDLARADGGLPAAERKALASSVTEIIHCAADIRFNLPIGEARRVNTAGTSTMIDLARRSVRLQRFAHVSTAFVQGRDAGLLPEAPFRNSRGFLNTYQQSKYEAEELVIQAMDAIPAAIFRLSSVIGDSVSGHVSQINYFHKVLRLIPRNPLPVMPAVPHYRVDLIADDWAASSLSVLYERNFKPGAIYNVCAGPGHSVSVGTLVETAFECFGQTSPPRLVSIEEFEAYAGWLREQGAGDTRRAAVAAEVSRFLLHLAIDQTFENEKTSAMLASAGIGFPDASFLRRILSNCAIPLGERPGRHTGPEERLKDDPLRPDTRVLASAEPAG